MCENMRVWVFGGGDDNKRCVSVCYELMQIEYVYMHNLYVNMLSKHTRPAVINIVREWPIKRTHPKPLTRQREHT